MSSRVLLCTWCHDIGQSGSNPGQLFGYFLLCGSPSHAANFHRLDICGREASSAQDPWHMSMPTCVWMFYGEDATLYRYIRKPQEDVQRHMQDTFPSAFECDLSILQK